jgi:hypothetical protein
VQGGCQAGDEDESDGVCPLSMNREGLNKGKGRDKLAETVDMIWDGARSTRRIRSVCERHHTDKNVPAKYEMWCSTRSTRPGACRECYPRRRFGQKRVAAKLHLEHEEQQRGSKVVRFIPTQDTAIEFESVTNRGYISPTRSINPAPLARHKPVIEELTKYLTQQSLSTPRNM